MAQPSNCEHCGAPLSESTFFCGECGQAVAAQQAKPVPKTTMLGAAGLTLPMPQNPQLGERITAAGISEPPRGAIGRTMLGMPQTPLPPDPESVAAELGAAAPAVQTPPASPRAAGRTMLGLPNAALVGSPQSEMTWDEAGPQPEGRPSKTASQTLLGLTDDSPPADEGRTAPEAEREPNRDRPSQERWKKNTPEAFPARKSRASGNRGSRASRPSSASLRGPRTPLLVAIGALIFASAVALGYLLLRRDAAPDVRVRVTSEPGGESLLFELPAAPDGAKIRFGGQEQKLSAGRATFPLAADSLRVGKNVVLYDVVSASGDVAAGRVALSVDYRVTLDTAPLRAGKGAVDIVVSALPGSKVFLDGQEVKLDGQGRALRTDKLELGSAAGRIEHVVSYRVQPPSGETSVGELRTSIPVTMIEIDRPGSELVTESDAVEIAGAVDKSAQVAIDGKPVEVVGGRFLHRMALPEVREYRPQIIATAEGKAPHAVSVHVTRVASLAEAAKGFDYDSALTYARMAQNPGIYRGQRVALEGRVYNVSVEGGRSALQMLVRECPKGQRCPIWVSYPAATEFTVDSWVRVLGVMQGEQQFRSETDEVKVVPKVEAAFLLPSRP